MREVADDDDGDENRAASRQGPCTRLNTKKEQLNKPNRLAATMITPVRKSTSVKTMEIL